MTDSFVYHEMLAHVPLFAHRHPKTVAILENDSNDILKEILKHETITTVWQMGAAKQNITDPRIQVFESDIKQFFQKVQPASLDIVIMGNGAAQINYAEVIKALHIDGILLQMCDSPFDLPALKKLQEQLQAAKFSDVLPLHFSQLTGPRFAMMAVKEGLVRRPREKDIFNKNFVTRCYNLDMHRAAFALPEFLRTELVGEK